MNGSLRLIHRLGLTALLLTAPLWAGEPAPPGPAPAPAPAPAPEAEKKPPPEEIFIFDPGDRRDPFSFCKEIPKIAAATTTTNLGDTGDVVAKMDPAQIAQKKMEAMTHYNPGGAVAAGDECRRQHGSLR